jgi:hypothetical protein
MGDDVDTFMLSHANVASKMKELSQTAQQRGTFERRVCFGAREKALSISNLCALTIC